MTNKDLTEKYDTKGIGLDHDNQTIIVGVDVDKDGKPDITVSMQIHNPLVWKMVVTALGIISLIIGYTILG